MFKRQALLPAVFLLFCVFLFSCQKEKSVSQDGTNTLSPANSHQIHDPATVTQLSSGFNNPRELKFGPDGNLYVAEAGVGGTTSSASFNCAQQAPFPFGPYHGSPTGGRISRVNANGNRTTVTDDLPTALAGIGDVFGAADVAFIGNQLYVLTAGGGCSHGVPSKPNGIYKVNNNGTTTLIANLSAWGASNPVAHPEPDDFEPDGNWYSMTVKGNDFYALDANHADLVKITPNGSINRVLDISSAIGHIVPTSIDNDGAFYVGNLSTFPIMGDSKVYRINQGGQVKTIATGLFTIVGLVLDNHDGVYVLEMATGPVGPPPLFPTPNSGKILWIDLKDPTNRATIATGLDRPTGMTMGPDGNLYVSARGFASGPGEGLVMKVALHSHDSD
jgi:hypothetical protein